jgi:hypothetical protein
MGEEHTMIRHPIGLAALAGLLVAGTGAQAQNYAPGPSRSYLAPRGPNLSPYLNMLRGGDPAANYFLGVVPERQRRVNDRIFQSEIQDLMRRDEASATAGLSDVLPPTGHRAVFNNTFTYFNSVGLRPATPQSPAGGGGAPQAGGTGNRRTP